MKSASPNHAQVPHQGVAFPTSTPNKNRINHTAKRQLHTLQHQSALAADINAFHGVSYNLLQHTDSVYTSDAAQPLAPIATIAQANLHVRVFATSVKYQADSLKTISVQKFRDAVPQSWDHESCDKAAHVVFNHYTR